MIKYICEHPVKVVDDSGNVNYMPCGHCETCLRKKVNKAYTLLNQVVYNYKHALFIHQQLLPDVHKCTLSFFITRMNSVTFFIVHVFHLRGVKSKNRM